MGKVKLAKATIGLAIAVAVGIALTALWWLGVFLIWWAGAEIISFSIIMGMIVLGGVVFGGGYAVDWALSVLSSAKEEEAAEELRSQEDKKLAAYVDNWGEGAVPPRLGSSKLYNYNAPPTRTLRDTSIG